MKSTQGSVFQGLHDLVVNFWGLELSEFQFESPDWNTDPVIFLDCDGSDQGNPLIVFLNDGVADKQELVFVCEGDEFKILTLTADGGFISCLIHQKDFGKLNMRTGGGLVAVKRGV